MIILEYKKCSYEKEDFIKTKQELKKRFTPGDIVYWCSMQNTGQYVVKWGMVDEQFSDAVCIDFLETKENRCIDGIPIDEFRKHENSQKYKKLPKGWTYNTELYRLETITNPEDEKLFNDLCVKIDNPESLKKAYELGLLVKADTKFHGNIRANITKEGYRVITEYPMWKHYQTYTSLRPDRVYSTYKEAKDEVDKNIAELQRQAALSDYDWSVEQIDKTLNFWQHLYDTKDEEKNAYRDWILDMKNVENIEVRLFCGNIQWKYEKNKKWNNIEL